VPATLSETDDALERISAVVTNHCFWALVGEMVEPGRSADSDSARATGTGCDVWILSRERDETIGTVWSGIDIRAGALTRGVTRLGHTNPVRRYLVRDIYRVETNVKIFQS
jgi:hypothetical protein